MYKEDKIIPLFDISSEIEKSYIDYAMAVMVSRVTDCINNRNINDYFIFELDKGKDYLNSITNFSNFDDNKKSVKSRLKNLKKYVFQVNAIKSEVANNFNDISENSRKKLFSIFSFFANKTYLVYTENNFFELLRSELDSKKILNYAISILKQLNNNNFIFFSQKKIINRLVRFINGIRNNHKFIDIKNSLRKILTTYSYFRFNTEEDALIIKNYNAVFTAKIF